MYPFAIVIVLAGLPFGLPLAEAALPPGAMRVDGRTAQLHLLVQRPGLSLFISRAAGAGQFRRCGLRLSLGDAPLPVQPAGPCSFTVSGLPAGGGEHRLRAEILADGHAERLEAVLRLPRREKAPDAPARAQWGVFAGLLGFVVATLFGALLALKRKE